MQLYFYNGQSTNYLITDDGKVFNNTTGKQLKGQKSKNGYWTVNIPTCKGKKRLYIHRMVLETYLPNENSINLEVNHIDANKDNNSINNLEWVTPHENKIHAAKLGLNNSKPVYLFNQNRELIASFVSMAEAERITGYSHSQISIACNSYPKIKAFNLFWSFSSDNNFEIREITNNGTAKPVGKYSLNGILLEEYQSIAEAARKNTFNKNHISSCCNGKNKTHKNFIWKFLI